MDMQKPQMTQIPIRELAIRYHQEGRFVEAMKAYRIAILLFPRDTVLSYNLGNLFRQIDQGHKAIACYELVLRLNPNDLPTLYNLAPLYRSRGERDKAIACYHKILELQPNNETAQYFLDALYGRTPERSPDAYVVELFDRYAPTFDHHITESLKYRGPQLLRELWQDCPSVPRTFPEALDLGCGTGLGAEALKAASVVWQGVDLSSAMLKKAEEKALYQSLHQQEIVSFLESQWTARHALILMADVVPYFGSLERLFATLSRSLTERSCLLFSTEEGRQDVELQTCGRYRHSFPAIRKVLRDHGFQLSAYRGASPRLQAGEPVPSGLYLASKISRPHASA